VGLYEKTVCITFDSKVNRCYRREALGFQKIYSSLSDDVRFYEVCKSWGVAEIRTLKSNSHTLIDYVYNTVVLCQDIKIRLLSFTYFFYNKHNLL